MYQNCHLAKNKDTGDDSQTKAEDESGRTGDFGNGDRSKGTGNGGGDSQTKAEEESEGKTKKGTKYQTETHGIDINSWYSIGTPESDLYERAECYPYAGFF